MALNRDITLEGQLPIVSVIGSLNTNLPVDFSNSTTIKLSAGTTINGSSLTALGTITSTSANALAVGRQGTTAPAFNVDSSTASQADGFNVQGLAAGNGVKLSAITSGTNSPLTLDAAGSGSINIGGTSTGMVIAAMGAKSAFIFGSTTTSIGTTQNSTPTAAQLLGGVVTQTSATGAGTVTTPTGTVLSAAIPGVATGMSFDCMFANLGGSFTLTITAGASGMTVIGNPAIPTGKNGLLTFVCTGSNTWVCYVVVSA